jgi:putative addiction module component (TIGR02574 family)
MVDRVLELADQGRQLVPEDRVRLLDLLLESLDELPSGEVEQAWAAEIERRVQAHERGEGRLYDMDEVLSEAVRIAP